MDMDEMKSKVLGAGLMAIGAAIPIYEKLRSTAETAGETPPGRLLHGALKLVEPVAKPVLGLIPGLGGHGEPSDVPQPSRGSDGPSRPVDAPAAKTSAATAEPGGKARSASGAKSAKKTSPKGPAKKPAGKKPAAKSSAAKTKTTKSPGKASGAGSKAAPKKAATRKSPAPAETTEAAIVDLPLPTYTHLKMPAILDALNGLTKPQLRQVQEYESGHENRKPILDRIDELLAVPLPTD